MTHHTPKTRNAIYSALIGYLLGIGSTLGVVAIVFWIGPSQGDPVWTVQQNFARSGSGLPERADSGQIWNVSSNGTSGATLKIVDGALTNVADGSDPAAGYMSVDLGKSVTSMMASYKFPERTGTTNGGAVGMLIRTDVPPPVPVGQFQLTSPAHLAISRFQMNFGVVNGDTISNIASERFDHPLDSGKLYTTTMELDYKNGIARVEGPDGLTHVYSDPRITINRGNVASFEIYQQNPAGDDRPVIAEVGAR